MNKRKLQEFASWAKQNLERQIELSLKKIGINSDIDVKRSRIVGDVTTIDGIETTFNKQFHHQREEIVNHIKDDGFKHSIEQFASTWFNRIIALRFLEVHDYLDHGYKLFPREPNTLPEILSKLSLVKDELKLDMNYIEEMTSSGNHNEELYRYVLFQQCSVLGKALPMLFSAGLSYLEHFIPTPLLFGDTIINRLIEIEENDFKEDVEIIGWLYQFYIATRKAEVFAAKEMITKDTLPAVTQLFTPNWIVKYMAENSIGRIWLESYPSSHLRNDMKYYVDEAKQEPEVEEQLKAIRYKNVNPEEIRIVEPCSGSGHILVYCFDLLFKMYQERGYTKKDIPALILKNNLVGFDIDQRATQLASFALIMRARSIDNKFFEEERYVRPKVYEIIDSKSLLRCNYNGKSYKEILSEYNTKQWNGENQLSNDELKLIDYLVSLFSDAKVIGSLLKVKTAEYLTIRKKLDINFKENTQVDLFTSSFFEHEFKELLEILRIAFFISQKYDVMITNPPYMGVSGLEIAPKSYLTKNYPNSKTDMFAMFMETDFVIQNGFLSMINMHSWMFLWSYENMRGNILRSRTLYSMAHLGTRAFEEISGEIVQTTTFIFRNTFVSHYIGKYHRLCGLDNKEISFLEGNNVSCISQKEFLILPSFIFAYWIGNKGFSIFKNSSKLSSLCSSKTGMTTGDNDRFLRLWQEIPSYEIGKKYQFYNKGGGYRKWYGNIEYVINWENNGELIKQSGRATIRNEHYYFKKNISWNLISTTDISVRAMDSIFVMGDAGPACYPSNEKFFIYLALLNSKVARYLLNIINPTMNYSVGVMDSFPVLPIVNETNVSLLAKDSVEISKNEWNNYERSWGFQKHPLINFGSLSRTFFDYASKVKSAFNRLKTNEETLNEYFITAYGLQNELSKEIDDAYVSISITDRTREIKSLISYLIGVILGRYSLVEDGLIYAGGTFDPSRYGNHDVDSDGIIPIYADISIEDGLVHRIIGLIKDIYGNENYRDNINFIAEALGKKSNETSEETLNRYLNDGFYQDHLKIYKKRPIYWMFSSGKRSGFKCLIYMHRYDQNTLAKINASYFQPATTILRNQINEVERQMSIVGDAEKRLLDKKRISLVEQLNEAREYGQVLDNMANKYLSIDLDDGVKVNYAKFQGIELTTNSGKVKKDLLVPIK